MPRGGSPQNSAPVMLHCHVALRYCLLQVFTQNGYTQHATQEQLQCFYALRATLVDAPAPPRAPADWQSQGLSTQQLTEAAQYYLTNLERVLHSQLITLREVSSQHSLYVAVKGPDPPLGHQCWPLGCALLEVQQR